MIMLILYTVKMDYNAFAYVWQSETEVLFQDLKKKPCLKKSLYIWFSIIFHNLPADFYF